jgi:hypothetical protein
MHLHTYRDESRSRHLDFVHGRLVKEFSSGPVQAFPGYGQ